MSKGYEYKVIEVIDKDGSVDTTAVYADKYPVVIVLDR